MKAPLSSGMTAEPSGARLRWRSVAVPTEHGGWGLTLEPVLLGLLVAPSPAGVALGVAAFVAFVVRTPLKLAVVDVRRDRWLARSALAAKIACGELTVIVAMAAFAVWAAGWSWLVPVAIAFPMVAIEAWFDARSRSRRLVPELCGAVGIGAVVAAIVVAGGESNQLAAALWLVLAARSIGAIPFVRVQIMRLRRGAGPTGPSDVAQLAAVAVGTVAVAVDHRVAAGLIGLVVLVALQAVWARRPPPVAKVLGMTQMGLGIGLVLVTAAGVAWS